MNRIRLYVALALIIIMCSYYGIDPLTADIPTLFGLASTAAFLSGWLCGSTAPNFFARTRHQ